MNREVRRVSVYLMPIFGGCEQLESHVLLGKSAQVFNNHCSALWKPLDARSSGYCCLLVKLAPQHKKMKSPGSEHLRTNVLFLPFYYFSAESAHQREGERERSF